MAASTISSWALYLGANAEGLDKGLKAAMKAVAAWSIGINAAVAVVGDVFGGLSTAFGLGDFSLSIQDIGSQVAEQFQQIDDAAKAAARTGTDIDSLLGLEHAAGLSGASSQTIRDGLVKMNRTISQAASGSRVAIAAFDALGISQEQLAGLDAVERYELIADGIAGMGDVAQQTATAMDIFGRGGAGALTALQMGGAALRAEREDYFRIAGRIGMGGSRDVEAANDAATRAQAAWTGIIRWLTVQLAPVKELTAIIMTELLAALRNLLPESTSLGDLMLTGFEMLTTGAVTAADTVLDFFQMMFVAAQDFLEPMMMVVGVIGEIVAGIGRMATELARTVGYNSAVDGIASGIANFGEAIGALPAGTGAVDMSTITPQSANPLFDAAAVNARIREFSANIRSQWDARRQTGDAGAIADAMNTLGVSYEEATAMVQRFNAAAAEQERQAEVARDVAKAMTDLDDRIANVGMTANQIQLTNLEEQGANLEDLFYLSLQQEHLAGLEAAQRLIGDLADPVAVLTQQMEGLDAMFAEGTITAEQHAMAMDNAITAAERASGIGEIKLASAALEGSREAVSAVMRHQIQGGIGNSPEERILRVQEQQREIQRQMLAQLQRANGGAAVVAQDGPDQG